MKSETRWYIVHSQYDWIQENIVCEAVRKGFGSLRDQMDFEMVYKATLMTLRAQGAAPP